MWATRSATRPCARLLPIPHLVVLSSAIFSCPRSRAALSYRSTPCAAPSRSRGRRRRPGAPHRGLSRHQNPWRRCCCPWEECGPAPASARERTRRASGAVVAALFWGSRAAPAGRYCDGLSQQPRVKTCGFQSLSQLCAAARAFDVAAGGLGARGSRRAEAAFCFGQAALRRDSGAPRRARQPAHGSVRHLDSAARKSDPAVGRSTHTRGTACLPRAALPNKGAPRP